MHPTSGRILLIVAAFALFLVPVAAIAAGGFTDVEDDSLFIADIQWMKDSNVTKGCNPPTNDRYCPKNNVTREQMSAFMHRLAVNKVVDAKTAVEAENADTLDGKDSGSFAASGHDHDADYLAIDGKAADANLLDGKNSTAFISGASWISDTRLIASWSNGSTQSLSLDCPGLDYPIAGGATENAPSGTVLSDSNPYFATLSNRGWTASFDNRTGSTQTGMSIEVWVLCADFELIIIPTLQAPEADNS